MTKSEFYTEIEKLDIPELMQLEIKLHANNYASAEWQVGFKRSQDIWTKTQSILNPLIDSRCG